MIRAAIRSLSGRVDLEVDGVPLALERLPRAHTIRQRLSRWARGPSYGIHGLVPTPISVTYAALGDAIRADLPDGHVDAAIGITKSEPFLYRGEILRLRIFPLRGRLAVESADGSLRARGVYGITHVTFTDYPRDFEPLLAALAVGFAIRVQWSQVAIASMAPVV